MKRMLRTGLCRLCFGYLRLLEKTVHLKGSLPDVSDKAMVVGFWHEDSYVMNLVLKKMAQGCDVSVLVTADSRGDYIEWTVSRCGGTAVRLPDGAKCRRFMKELLEEAKKPDTTIAAALDGPLGPRRIPKSLAYFLSEKGGKEFAALEVTYSKAISLPWRWDHYRIPLPFTTVTVAAENYGVADRKAKYQSDCPSR